LLLLLFITLELWIIDADMVKEIGGRNLD